MVQRVAIYSRFSSDLQRKESLGDQHEVCQRYARDQGWVEVGFYSDAAMSGASRHRPGLQRLLADAKRGLFDIVLCEGVDRLGRRLADLADMHDQLTFQRVKFHVLGIGEVTPVVLGVMGAVAQQQLLEIGSKTKRGQLGRVRAGRVAGGLAYGYEVVPPPPGAKESGARRIVEAEAEIVRQIFRDFANGSSPRAIAQGLNASGVPGPGGRPWGDTTIRGQVERGTGILNNALYAGQIAWDRCRYVKDPSTGKRVARPVPPEQWERKDVPELRIVDQSLWEKVKARQQVVRIEMSRDEQGNALNRAHRQSFLFSGLLSCSCCGGQYVISQKERYGCSHRRGKGTCRNGVSIRREALEARVLVALKERLLAPDLVAEFVRAYAEMQRERQREAGQERRMLQEQADAIDKKLQGVMRAIEGGAWSDTLNDHLKKLDQEKLSIKQCLEAAGDPEPVTLHPNASAVYRRQVEHLQTALNDPNAKPLAMEALRALVDKIVLTPEDGERDGLRIELYGALAAILRLGEHKKPGKSNDLPVVGTDVLFDKLSVVAGTCNRRSHHLTVPI